MTERMNGISPGENVFATKAVSARVLPIFQDYVANNWDRIKKTSELESDFIILAGFVGEKGECLEHFKKLVRDYKGDVKNYPDEKRFKFILECGDHLHYFVRMMQRFGVTLEEVMCENMRKLDARYPAPKE